MKSALSILVLALFALACSGGGGGGGVAANGDGISGTGEFKLSKIDLAHASYGEGDYGDFVLNSLSPVLKVELGSPIDGDPRDLFEITLQDLTGGGTLTVGPGEDELQNVIIESGQDGSSFYLEVGKAASLNLGTYELQPGHHYRYVIRPVSGGGFEVDGERQEELEGYLRLRHVTITYLGNLKEGDGLVRDGVLKGIATLQPEFMIHTDFDLESDSLPLGPLSLLELKLGSLPLLKSGSELIEVLDLDTSAVHVKVNAAPLDWGGDYDLSVEPKEVSVLLDDESLNLVDDHVPGTLRLEMQDLD